MSDAEDHPHLSVADRGSTDARTNAAKRRCQCCGSKHVKMQKMERKQRNLISAMENDARQRALHSANHSASLSHATLLPNESHDGGGEMCPSSAMSTATTETAAQSGSDSLSTHQARPPTAESIRVSRKYISMRQRLQKLLLSKQQGESCVSSGDVIAPTTSNATTAGSTLVNHIRPVGRKTSDSHCSVNHSTVSSSSVAPQSVADSAAAVPTAADKSPTEIERLVDYIEGKKLAVTASRDSSAEKLAKATKKRLKKERQKRQKMEQWEAVQMEKERLRKLEEAEEAARRRAVVAEQPEWITQKERSDRKEQSSSQKKNNSKKGTRQKASKSGSDEQGDVDVTSISSSDLRQQLDALIVKQQEEMERMQRLHRQQFEQHVQLLKEQAVKSVTESVAGTAKQKRTKVNTNTHPPSNLACINNNKTSTVKCGPKSTATKVTKSVVSSQTMPPAHRTSNVVDDKASSSSGKGNIKIRRLPDGTVEFIAVSEAEMAKASAASSNRQYGNAVSGKATRAQLPSQPRQPLQPPQLKTVNRNNNGDGTVKKVTSPSPTPMVTIRRVHNPSSADQSTVTISMKSGSGEGSAKDGNRNEADKLLYTLVNGRLIKSSSANATDLIPGLEAFQSRGCAPIATVPAQQSGRPTTSDASIARRVKKSTGNVGASVAKAATAASPSKQSTFPIGVDGKVDLKRLDLPPGITISKVDREELQRHQQREHQQLTQTAKLTPNGSVGNLSATLADLSLDRQQHQKQQAGGTSDGTSTDASSNKKVLIRNVNGRAVIMPVL